MRSPTWLRPRARARKRASMGVFKNIFTWWEGATFGTWLHTRTRGTRMGEDDQGNVYYEGGSFPDGMPRRWVMYSGNNDASRVPAEWHGWLHNTLPDVPETMLPAPRTWERPGGVNPTGSLAAYKPAGAPESGGHRARATGDYEAWSPDAA
jgi:NADH:ubiquinone oxidoreductase subunit